MKKTLLSLAAITSLCGAIDAQAISLEALTVTSTPLQDTELNAADAVEIYTAEEIEKAHVQSLYEFLNLQSSVFAAPSYGNPMAQKLDLHGYGIENGYQNIVITLNGRRLNNIDMVPQLLSSISPSDIERLEIIKSGGIVLGGDGANAGVINITTKNDSSKELSVYGGIYNTYDGSFRVGHSDDLLSVSASGEAYHTDGTRHINAAQDRDTQKLANGAFDIILTPTEALELRMGAQASHTDTTYGGTMTQEEYEMNPSQPGTTTDYLGNVVPSSPTAQQYDTDAVNAGATYAFTPAWSLHADFYHEKKKSEYITYASTANYIYKSVNAGVDYDTDTLRVTMGFEGFKGTRSSGETFYSLASETSKNNGAGYLLAQLRLGSHTLKAGYRYEEVNYHYSDALENISDSHTLHGAELGYNYVMTPARSVFVNYAHAYQAPDIDRFFTLTYPAPAYAPVVVFNGFIEPMTSDSITMGYTAVTPTNKLKLSAYYVALHNEIYYNSYIGAYGTNTNIDRSHKYGLDLYDMWKLSDKVSFLVNYNYVQAIIDDEKAGGQDYSGNTLPGVSEHNLKAALTFMPAEALTCTLSHTYRSSAYALNDIGNDFAQKQQPYNSTDVSVSYAQDSYTLFARINNMFNNPNGLWVQDDAIYPYNFTTTAIAGATLKF